MEFDVGFGRWEERKELRMSLVVRVIGGAIMVLLACSYAVNRIHTLGIALLERSLE
jgi:hypothetical protein